MWTRGRPSSGRMGFDTQGATAIEYGLIAVAIMGALFTL
jgi:Flp pilus assembly pilin Flp